MNKLLKGALVSTGALLIMGSPVVAHAAKGDHGVDNAVYQGTYGKFGYAHDKFMISQMGGYTGTGIYDQSTYATQVQSAIAQGKRAHSYIWWQNVTSNATADAVLDHFLPKVQTPKGSIIALDIESGAQSTDVIMHALQRIKDAGYTPMVYGYLNYLKSSTDLQRISDSYQLWLAEYPDYNVTPEPNYNYFPSFNNVGIFQFTSTYVAGGLDGNIDLTGITDNGYKNGDADKPKSDTPAIDKGQQADDTSKKDIKAGDTVKVNFSADKWATGESIPQYIKGQSYKVVAVDGDKLLLDGVNSWINRTNAEIISTKDTVQFNGAFVLDSWQYEFGNVYVRNNDMAIQPADWQNDIPASAVTLTDKYGVRLANQNGLGNNGSVEYFTLDKSYKVLERSGNYVKVLIDNEPVWLQASYAE
ncbi:GH25 family lysozyme [Weissella confusa]|uniref:GH25 family lysozyme n=1 Tax=Weissella confusa TaxID=1583 RepID=UPI0022FE9697|nr:GH25 family lysozyme [Weissella confusa]